MELDSGMQLNRFWDGHVKRINTSNLDVPIQIKIVQVDERFRKIANKKSEEFNATHKLQTFRVRSIIVPERT